MEIASSHSQIYMVNETGWINASQVLFDQSPLQRQIQEMSIKLQLFKVLNINSSGLFCIYSIILLFSDSFYIFNGYRNLLMTKKW